MAVNLAEARRFARNTRPTRVQDSDYFALEGGLNVVDASLKVRPGELLGALNYEAKVRGGYESLRGYERYDGRDLPSQASYWIVDFDAQANVANDPTVGGTLSAASGGTATILKFEDSDDDGIGRVICTRLTGTWTDNTAITNSSFSASLNGVPQANTSATDAEDEEYRALAIANQRAFIAEVPGSGAIRGVVLYRGVTYAFRDNAGATACVMHRATSSGWQAVSLGWKLRFTAGLVAGIAEGDTLTGATSSATGTVRKVVVTSGSFAAGTAAGYLILTGVAGTYSNAENLTVGGTNRATANGASAAQTLTPGGRFEFRVHNFYGHTRLTRLYGVDGKNRAFEYQDGASEFFCQIDTGMAQDTPNHLGVFQGQLWLSFAGGSVQHSGVNDAALFTVLTGAAEIGIGDDCTGFLEEVGTVMFVFSRNKTSYIEGNPADGYALRTFNIEVGAMEHTVQRIGQGTYLDDRGFATLATTDRFGNYAGNSISEKIAPIVRTVKNEAVASCISKNYDRYRCFFNDGQFISITFRDRKPIAHMRCDYGRIVRCVWGGEDATGAERIVFGSDGGYVYVADSGTSFDGDAIGTFGRLPFHHSRAPSRLKRYRAAEFDVIVEGKCSISIAVDYTYARSDVPGDPTKNIDLTAGGGFWDVSLWDQFRWNAGYAGRASVKLEASGQNLSFLFSSSSAVQPAHAIDGVRLLLSYRRLERGVG